MSFINKISNILKHDRNNDLELEDVQKILLLNLSLVISSVFSFLFSLTHFFFFEKTISYALFPYFIIFTSIFFIFKQTKNYKLCSVVSIILITSLFLLLLIANVGLLWGLTYPILISLTYNVKKANWFSLIFLSLTLIIFFIPSDLWSDYSTDLKIRYTGVYLAILLFLQYYLRFKQQTINYKNKQLIEARQKLREKDEFLSSLSYQIRTPLNNIAGIFNIKRDALGENTVEEVELSISNLITIVNSIPESFDKKILQIKGEKTLFNINSTIKKSVALFQTNKYSNIKCSLHLSNKIPQFIYGDRLLIIQIIISVIDFLNNNKDNEALKIDLISTLKEDSDSVLLKIKGISDYNFLNPYLNNESNVDFDEVEIPELLTINELTRSLSGECTINYSKLNTSFIFNFNFPANQPIEKDLTDSLELTNKEDFFNKKNKKELKDATVLLVEDDLMNSKIMTLNLQKHVNKIIIAINGKEALEKYASTRFDIVLMDIRMALMDGFKTTEKIREAEIGIGYQIPIIAVTANASDEIKKKCFDVGMNDYTTKPIDFQLLLKKMQEQLS